MAVTRAPDYPVEIAQLMQAFNVAADGFDVNVVLNASLQMVAASVGFIVKQKGGSLNDALAYADHVASVIKKEVEGNWARLPEADDVVVKSS